MKETMLNNLQRILVFIRFDIKNEVNYQLVNIIIEAINNDKSNEEMCKVIFGIMPEWKGQLIIKDSDEKELACSRELKLFIIRTLELIKDSVSIQEYEKAYDVADMIHALPDIIIANQKKGLKQYWKIYVKPFRKKWHCYIFDKFKYAFA